MALALSGTTAALGKSSTKSPFAIAEIAANFASTDMTDTDDFDDICDKLTDSQLQQQHQQHKMHCEIAEFDAFYAYSANRSLKFRHRGRLLQSRNLQFSQFLKHSKTKRGD